MITDKEMKDQLIQQFKTAPLVNGTVELLDVKFKADQNYILREPNYAYIKRELDWYASQSLDVRDIPGKTPKIWVDISSHHYKINSNYGWAIYSDANGQQFNHAITALKRDPQTRQSIMIYNRPSMHVDYQQDGMSDFMCALNNQLFIRDDTLYSYVYMRSNDAVFGYNNDVAWFKYVFAQAYKSLSDYYPTLKLGDLIWHANSLHVYSRHFELLTEGDHEQGEKI